jgi:hypothetical protein
VIALAFEATKTRHKHTIGEVRRHHSNRVLVDVRVAFDLGQRAQHVRLVGARISVETMDDDHGSLDLASVQTLAVGSIGHVVDEGQVGGLLAVAVLDTRDLEEGDLGTGNVGQVGFDNIAGKLLG